METDRPIRTYKAAGGVVVNPTGELVLVLVRAKRLRPDGKPEVRLPKGHIESGESPMEAATREVREESGVSSLEVLSDLGRQRVSFVWQGTHYRRDEFYFLMTIPSDAEHGLPESQFERLWLAWHDALDMLTFEAEREWIRRGRLAWNTRLQDISD